METTAERHNNRLVRNSFIGEITLGKRGGRDRKHTSSQQHSVTVAGMPFLQQERKQPTFSVRWVASSGTIIASFRLPIWLGSVSYRGNKGRTPPSIVCGNTRRGTKPAATNRRLTQLIRRCHSSSNSGTSNVPPSARPRPRWLTTTVVPRCNNASNTK